MKTKQMPRNQLTKDMQQPVAKRLEQRYGTRPDVGFSYRVVNGVVERV